MDSRVALLIGCSQELEAALRPHFEPRLETEWRELTHALAADLVLIGPEEPDATLAAQHLAKLAPAARLVLYVPTSELQQVREVVDQSPNLPMDTQVLGFPDPQELERVVHLAATRITLQAARDRDLQRDAPGSALDDFVPLIPNFFYQWFRQRRDDLAPEILATLSQSPGGDTLLALIHNDRLAGSTDERRALEHRAFIEGDLQPFVDSYRERGRHFAAIGVSLTTWLHVLGALRRVVWERWTDSSEFDPRRVGAFATGLEHYTQVTFGALLQGWQAAIEEGHHRLHERERLFTALVESSQDVILSKTPDGTITAWNRAAEELYGYPASDALGQHISLIVPEDRRAELDWVMREVRAGRGVRNLVTRRVSKDGRSHDVAITVSPIRNNLGQVVAASTFARDMSDRLGLERRNAAILAGAIDAIITIDDAGQVVEFNAAAQTLFGYSMSEAVGRELAELVIPEEERAAHRAGLAHQRAGGKSRILGRRVELVAQRKGGSRFPVEASIVRLAGTDPPLFTAFVRDLTELKRAKEDLRRIITDLTRSNSDLEQFAYVASHDLQEPLRMVSAYMDLLQRDYAGQLDERAQRFIQYATTGGKRMKELIDDLLAYSRIEAHAVKPTACDCGEIVDIATQNLKRLVDDSAGKVTWSDLPSVDAEAGQLLQLFQNLIGNGLKFRRADAPPEVHVSATDAGTEWLFCVRDNGVGFEPRFADRIFQMFQRLHPRTSFPGSGIGLAVAKRIVERHGGRIWAESEPGQGTLFYFTLPIQPRRGSLTSAHAGA
ncbi:MAG: PAS domain S-box protein [Myxococcales bacterium]|nr:PAS domain S-box protein [Myxococcales bacterium]